MYIISLLLGIGTIVYGMNLEIENSIHQIYQAIVVLAGVVFAVGGVVGFEVSKAKQSIIEELVKNRNGCDKVEATDGLEKKVTEERVVQNELLCEFCGEPMSVFNAGRCPNCNKNR